MTKKKFIKCPVCEQYTFAAEDSHEKCPVCGWINDSFQAEHKFVGHGTNHFSLAQQQKAWKILNLEYEVGYGTDNLLWGTGLATCKLCGEKICIDECKYHMEQLLEGKLPEGVSNLEEAGKKCAHCILSVHNTLNDPISRMSMVESYSDRDTYGNGCWGAGSNDYNLKEYQSLLKSLINFCHNKGTTKIKTSTEEHESEPDFMKNKEILLEMMQKDERERRNYNSYFCRTLLSIADFIRYASDENDVLDHKFSLWAFGEAGNTDKYHFTEQEKQFAAKVLHISLSFINYRCDDYTLGGLYFLDNRYQNWEADEFSDIIAAWFVDIGTELDEDALKMFIRETLKESFAYSHVKLALNLLSHLGYAKTDRELQELVELYCRVPALEPLAKSCLPI